MELLEKRCEQLETAIKDAIDVLSQHPDPHEIERYKGRLKIALDEGDSPDNFIEPYEAGWFAASDAARPSLLAVLTP